MPSKSILLIEDDPLVIENVKAELSKLKTEHSLEIAYNGAYAIASLTSQDLKDTKGVPDIILLNVNMPVMSGIECLRIIKNYQRFKDIKIYVLSASNGGYDMIQAMNLGASGYITIPLDFNNTSKKSESMLRLKADLEN